MDQSTRIAALVSRMEQMKAHVKEQFGQMIDAGCDSGLNQVRSFAPANDNATDTRNLIGGLKHSHKIQTNIKLNEETKAFKPQQTSDNLALNGKQLASGGKHNNQFNIRLDNSKK